MGRSDRKCLQTSSTAAIGVTHFIVSGGQLTVGCCRLSVSVSRLHGMLMKIHVFANCAKTRWWWNWSGRDVVPSGDAYLSLGLIEARRATRPGSTHGSSLMGGRRTRAASTASYRPQLIDDSWQQSCPWTRHRPDINWWPRSSLPRLASPRLASGQTGTWPAYQTDRQTDEQWTVSPSSTMTNAETQWVPCLHTTCKRLRFATSNVPGDSKK